MSAFWCHKHTGLCFPHDHPTGFATTVDQLIDGSKPRVTTTDLLTPRDNRPRTHHVGDRCPGGHHAEQAPAQVPQSPAWAGPSPAPPPARAGRAAGRAPNAGAAPAEEPADGTAGGTRTAPARTWTGRALQAALFGCAVYVLGRMLLPALIIIGGAR